MPLEAGRRLASEKLVGSCEANYGSLNAFSVKMA
jgi:hypothetical protein